jgi:hypothetical protein
VAASGDKSQQITKTLTFKGACGIQVSILTKAGVRMDPETKEYLERILLGLTGKEDLEKLRQETKSNFRQLKEENRNQILEWKQEIKADLDQLKGQV